MNAADNVSVRSQLGVITVQVRGRVTVSLLHLSASQAERIAPQLIELAAEIMRHPLYETLREDQR